MTYVVFNHEKQNLVFDVNRHSGWTRGGSITGAIALSQCCIFVKAKPVRSEIYNAIISIVVIQK